ncbi:hypothetical protein [[Muricauda] lutisoli]|uniref:Uncharacterized protein n=1 Tax=[Muricauda] lutisoli TaxID=2816035 RepID=A0ABS3EUT0_9FLAO|nr:hypothetical protein [[Muricauda] lutisoli]MBO0329903.1 hypothetical protein [[Muricauda] lutisoli]
MAGKFKFTFFLFCMVSMLSSSQEKDNLVELLTEVNLQIETKVLTDYCNCNDKKQFIESYQQVAIKFNKIINKHMANLSVLKTRKSLDEFGRINNPDFVANDLSLKNALNELKKFQNQNCDNNKAFWPAAITIAEITGIANSVIGLINEGKKRRDAQRDKLIAILETLKIPSIQNYKCEKDSKLD